MYLQPVWGLYGVYGWLLGHFGAQPAKVKLKYADCILHFTFRGGYQQSIRKKHQYLTGKYRDGSILP